MFNKFTLSISSLAALLLFSPLSAEEAVKKDLPTKSPINEQNDPNPSSEIASIDIGSLKDSTQPFSAPSGKDAFSVPQPTLQTPYKSPTVATALSTILPGLGHLYLEEYSTAAALFGTVSASAVAAADPFDANTSTEGIIVANQSYTYGIYAAYRDARIFNGLDTYRYKMPVDSFSDLAYAAFSPSVLKKPTVWGGIVGGLTLAYVVTRIGYGETCLSPIANAPAANDIFSNNPSPLFPLTAFSVGIGEESFFRGYLQSAIIEETNPAVGIALSSIFFGAAHIPNADVLDPQDRWRYYSFSVPLITALGTYFGILTYNSGSLQESVAVHSWYDFILFAATLADARNNPEASLRIPQTFALNLPF